MRPTLDEVMQTIEATFDAHVLPMVTGELPASLALTTSNLLRHVLERIRYEEIALREGNADLRAVLVAVDDAGTGGRELPASVDAVAEGISSLTAENRNAEALRARLEEDIRQLDALADPRPETRALIAAYLDRQLAREASWMSVPFTGPRR